MGALQSSRGCAQGQAAVWAPPVLVLTATGCLGPSWQLEAGPGAEAGGGGCGLTAGCREQGAFFLSCTKGRKVDLPPRWPRWPHRWESQVAPA